MNKKSPGCIRKRTDGCWEGRIYTEDGKRHYFYGNTYEQVRRKLTEVVHDIDEGAFIDETDMTVDEWLTQWTDTYLDVKASTLLRYKRDIRLYISPSLGKKKLRDLTVLQVQKLYRNCRATGLSSKSIHNLHGILHEALKHAVKYELIKRNVADMCDLPKLQQVEMHPLTDSQIPLFLDASKGDLFEVEYYVAIFTGLRESEIVGLTWDCVDFKRGTIRIYRQYVRLGSAGGQTACGFTSCKNGRTRLIEPAHTVMELLKKVRDEQNIMRIMAGDNWDNTSSFVFTKPDGSPIQYQTMYKHFKQIVASIGLPEVRFHDLRHTYATLSLQNGVDIKTVSSSLGHATIAFTLDKYGHVSSTMRHSAAEKIDQYIKSISEEQGHKQGHN